jgi:hypothetical protein
MWFKALCLTAVSAYLAGGIAGAAEAPNSAADAESKPAITSTENSDGAAKPAEGSNAAAPAEEAPAVAPLKGDILHMKNGKTISGFQVLRETSAVYVLEVVEGEDITLEVPRRQVVSIDYDDIDPNAPKPPAASAAGGEPELVSISGQKVTPELQEKLSMDISSPSLEYTDTDLVQILKDVGERVNGSLAVDQSVVDMLPTDRIWTVTVKPGTTLIQFLREDLKAKFESLEWVLLTDKVVIATKEGAEKLRSENKPAEGASPQPGAPAEGAAPAPEAPTAPLPPLAPLTPAPPAPGQ